MEGKTNKNNNFNIIAEIIDTLDAKFTSETIKRVVVGVYMTAVETHSIGCTYTLRDKELIPHLNPDIRNAGFLAGKTAEEVIRWYNSNSSLERSIAVAAMNTCLNRQKDQLLSGDPLLYIRERFEGKKVAMVGHFPFAEEICEWAGEFSILELNPTKGDRNYNEAKEILKTVDMTVVTGVTLLNGTFNDVVQNADSSFILMLGPTVPFSTVLFDHGVDMISSLVVSDSDNLFNSIAEGAIVPKYRGGEIMSMTRESGVKLPAGDFRLRIGRNN
ncbi:hypothetical protein KAJ27_01205 [bacterium]|nr:hypothetical protein [bacterium]